MNKKPTRNKYPKEFFSIQLDFGRKASEVDPTVTFEEALYEYTYIANDMFGIKEYPPTGNEQWSKFISILNEASSVNEGYGLVYSFYTSLESSKPTLSEVEDTKRFGPFSYAYYPDETTVGLHFRNIRSGEEFSSLSSRYFEENSIYFKDMLQSIYDSNPKARLLVTSTWLNNLDVYTVYFPKDLKDSLNEKRCSFTGIWQQFLNKDGLIHEGRSNEFYEKLSQVTTVEDLYNVFPFKALEGKVEIDKFYEMYGVE
jgi:hypothetical protein